MLDEHTVPGRLCILTASPVLGVPQEHRLRCIMCLLWGADLRLPPSWQISTIQDPRKTWLATGSLLTVCWRMPVSGAGIGAAPCLPDLAVACLPLCLWELGEGAVCSWLALLCYSLNPLFCEWARLHGKVLFLFFFLSDDPTVWVVFSR